MCHSSEKSQRKKLPQSMEASTHNVLEKVVASRVLGPALCTHRSLTCAHLDTMKTAMAEAQRTDSVDGTRVDSFHNVRMLGRPRSVFQMCSQARGMLMSLVGCIGHLMEGTGLFAAGLGFNPC